jgi:hypothetical protein
MNNNFKAAFGLDNPDDMRATLSLTMTLGDWKKLREQLSNGTWPSYEVGYAIRDVVDKAEKRFTSSPPEEPAD